MDWKLSQNIWTYWKLFDTENTRTVTEHGQLATRTYDNVEFWGNLAKYKFLNKPNVKTTKTQLPRQPKIWGNEIIKFKSSKKSVFFDSVSCRDFPSYVKPLRNLTVPLMRARDNINIYIYIYIDRYTCIVPSALKLPRS